MTLLVTGASGFVGSEVVAAALAAGHRVRALVRATSDTRKLDALPDTLAPTRGEGRVRGQLATASAALHESPPRVELVYGDVTNRDSVRAAMAHVSAVIHVAGLVKAANEAAFARVNRFGAEVVASEAAAAGVARFILVSSLAARGPDALLHPVSAYGRSKLAGEIAVRAALGSTPALVIVRPTAIYGPGDRELLPSFQLAHRGLRVVLKGGGVLSMLHVRDLAVGLVGLVGRMEVADLAGTTFDVSDGGLYSWIDLVSAIAAAVGRQGTLLELPLGLFRLAAAITDGVAAITRRPQVFGRDKLAEMQGSWSADPSPFWRAAGEAPRSLAEGLADTVASYRAVGWL